MGHPHIWRIHLFLSLHKLARYHLLRQRPQATPSIPVPQTLPQQMLFGPVWVTFLQFSHIFFCNVMYIGNHIPIVHVFQPET